MLTTLNYRILLAMVLLYEIAYQIVIPIIEPLLHHLQTTQLSSLSVSWWQGMDIALFTGGVMLGAPLLGYLSDRFPRKALLMGCLLLLMLSAGCLSVALAWPSLLLFGVGRWLGGVSGGAVAVIQGLVAVCTVGKQRAVCLSHIGLMLTIGTILGPMAGGYLSGVHAWALNPLQWPFIAVLLLTLVLILSLLPLSLKVPRVVVSAQSGGAFMWLIGSFFLLESMWSLYFQLIPVTLKSQWRCSDVSTGLWMSSMGVVMCVALGLYPYLAKRWRLSHFIHGSLALCLLAAALKLWSASWVALLGSMGLMALGVAWAYVSIMAAYADSVQLSYQGAAMGLTLSVMALAWTITGSVARVLYHASAQFSSVVVLALVMVTWLVFQKPFGHRS